MSSLVQLARRMKLALGGKRAAAIARLLSRYQAIPVRKPARHSTDLSPWRHPFLTEERLRRFRARSEAVWDIALAYDRKQTRPLNVAFAVNMAQNMYKWAVLAQEHGARASLFLHPWDQSAMSTPEWEEFDGEYADVHDGAGFKKAHLDLVPRVPCRTPALGERGFAEAHRQFVSGTDRSALYRLLADFPSLRHEVFANYGGDFLPFFNWACELAAFDALYIASVPVPAYLSGRPYCAFSVGGDLALDCGRPDYFGEMMGLSFNAARFILLSNPHPLAHCRRLGFGNALYLPYAMDDHRYCPAESVARAEWQARFGGEIFVLATARIDNQVKGNGESMLNILTSVARVRPQLRFVFLAWGHHAAQLRAEIADRGLGSQFIFLSPVGKKRLIDYYRSCDIVLDQFVYGYYGATALEAAAVGKPIVMMLRDHHYQPLYGGDVAPVENVANPEAIHRALLKLVDQSAYRQERGRALRSWLVRNHGHERTMPLLLALLRLAADNVALPADLDNPLLDPLDEAEERYHASCLQPVSEE